MTSLSEAVNQIEHDRQLAGEFCVKTCYLYTDIHFHAYIVINLYFLKKFLADTCPFLGPLVPPFWISGDVSSGFQSQSGFCLIHVFAEVNVMYIPTSSATHADLLAAGVQPVTYPCACAEVGLGSDSNRQSPTQKTNVLPLWQRPG